MLTFILLGCNQREKTLQSFLLIGILPECAYCLHFRAVTVNDHSISTWPPFECRPDFQSCKQCCLEHLRQAASPAPPPPPLFLWIISQGLIPRRTMTRSKGTNGFVAPIPYRRCFSPLRIDLSCRLTPQRAQGWNCPVGTRPSVPWD